MAKGLDDALARDDADQGGAAHNGEIVLQAVDGLVQRVG
jgi:hypothetical protein